MSILEDAIIIALKEMRKNADNHMLRYSYVQNWFTNVLKKCEPEINVTEFYKKLND